MAHEINNSTITTVEELLLCHDEHFVRLAFSLILERGVDPDGLASYLSEIRRGVSKTELIVALTKSPEAISRESRLTGLKELVARYERRPLRRIRAALTRLISDDAQPLAQTVRAFQNETYRREASLFAQLEASEKKLQELADLNRSLLGRLLHIGQQRTESQVEANRIFPALDKRRRLVFNLSTSKHWRSRAVGIIRMERELAKYLSEYSDVVFVFWDRGSKEFIALAPIEVTEILSDGWCNPSAAVAEFEWLRTPAELLETDCFVSLGLDWDLCPLYEIAKPLRESCCEVVMACYDLVPILFPEFCVEDNFDQRFRRHFVDMAHLADHVFAISTNSANDLREFWEGAQLETTLPKIHRLPLANLRAAEKLPRLDANDTDRLRHLRAHRPYVLYVSSIEARKNHRLLINVWKELHRERADRCPVLVLVGMRGWGTSDLLGQVQRMSATAAGKIVVLSDVNDDMLSHLYKHCAFTVFPSYYEGWGLAATEAMAFGKACLVSDTGALIEATQNLMPRMHPKDQPVWKREIESLLDETSARQRLEDCIRSQFVSRDWSDVSRDFVSQLIG